MGKNKFSFFRFLFIVLVINLLIAMANYYTTSSSANNEKGPNGEKIFKSNCSGCHLNGENLIRPNKPIIGSAKLKSKVLFKDFLHNPPKPMPSFENITEKEDKLDALYKYVISLMGK